MEPAIVIVTACVAIVLATAAVLVVLLRFRWLCRRPGSVIMSLGRPPKGGRRRWRLGVARMKSAQLEWHAARSLAWWPTKRWDRGSLDIVGRESAAPMADQRISIVQCREGTAQFEVLMSDRAYAGFSSWQESAPPRDSAHVL